jgi:excisionase family DNA binding protein
LELLTISKASKYLQISEPTTYKLLHDGKIDTLRVGRQSRIKKMDLDVLLNKMKSGEKI